MSNELKTTALLPAVDETMTFQRTRPNGQGFYRVIAPPKSDPVTLPRSRSWTMEGLERLAGILKGLGANLD